MPFLQHHPQLNRMNLDSADPQLSPWVISTHRWHFFFAEKESKIARAAKRQTVHSSCSTNWPRCSGCSLQGGMSGPGGTQSEQRMDCCACWRGGEVRPPRRGWGTEGSCLSGLGSRSQRPSARAEKTPHRRDIFFKWQHWPHLKQFKKHFVHWQILYLNFFFPFRFSLWASFNLLLYTSENTGFLSSLWLPILSVTIVQITS